jgi:hypothetical protein
MYCWDSEQQALVEIVLRAVPITPETENIFKDVMSLAVKQADRARS